MSFNKICADIKSLKIQGATNVAKAGIKALRMRNDSRSVNKLLSLRPTEPLLQHCIKYARTDPKVRGRFALAHIDESREILAKEAAKLIGKSVYTHCHSSSVIESFRQAKKMKKKFEVHCTETRPLYQGRKTAKDCRTLRLKTTFYPDSAGRLAIKRSDAVFLGADAITPKKVLNKIGSELFTEIAVNYDKPVYILSDSWKYLPHNIKIEERPTNEVWKNPPAGLNIVNCAFEQVDPKHITGIISELGVMSYKEFMKTVPKTYPEIYTPKGRKR